MRLKNPVRTIASLLFLKTPLEAQLIITRRCNLSCGYCTEYDDFSPPVPLEDLKKRIDALHRLRVVNISLLGGEPLMHPEIEEIIRYGDHKAQVSVTTNGFLITPELVEKLNRSGLANLEISIDSFGADPSGYIQKTLKTLYPKLEILKNHAKFDVHANIVLCEQTKHKFEETVAKVRSFGCHVSVDILHTETGQVGVQGEDYVEIWDKHFKQKNSFTDIDYNYGRALLQGKKPDWLCRAGSRCLYVDEFGKVQYCSSTRGRLNKPVTEYTLEDLKIQSKKVKGCEEGCSLLCVYRDSMIDNEPGTVLKAFVGALRNGVLSQKQAPALQPS